jgi:hypothetical protein
VVAACSHARRGRPRPGLPTQRSERYRPRRPDKTPLHRIVTAHLETWLESRDRAEEPVPPHVEEEFRAFLRCGILCCGFARARCTACGHGFLIGFSCKGRGVCPSCNGRRMAQTAAHLVDRVIPPVPVRQWVISVPKRLRCFLADRPEAVTALRFSIDSSVRVALADRDVPDYFKSLEHLLRYCARPAFALERLFLLEARDGRPERIRYALSRHKRGTWIGPLARASRPHPTPRASSTSRPTRPAGNDQPRSHDTSRIAWAKLLARIGEQFPLQCPACGGDIRLIAFITDPAPIRKILEAIGEPLEPPPLAPARGPPIHWLDLVQAHDDGDVVQTTPDEFPLIDIHAL